MADESDIDAHRRTYAPTSISKAVDVHGLDQHTESKFNQCKVMRVILSTPGHIASGTLEPITLSLPITDIAHQHPANTEIILDDVQVVGVSGTLIHRCLLHGFVAKAGFNTPISARTVAEVSPICTTSGCRQYGINNPTVVPASELIVGSVYAQHNTNIISLVRPAEQSQPDDGDTKEGIARMEEMCALLDESALKDKPTLTSREYVDIPEHNIYTGAPNPIAWLLIDKMHELNNEQICNCEMEKGRDMSVERPEQGNVVRRGMITGPGGGTYCGVRVAKDAYMQMWTEMEAHIRRASSLKSKERTLYIELIPLKEQYHSESTHASRADAESVKDNIVTIHMDIFTTSRSKPL